MLSFAAFGAMHRGAFSRTAALGLGYTGRATYQTHSFQGRHIYGRNNWGARLLAYLRNGLDLLTDVATRRFSSATAARRLRMVMLQRPSSLLRGFGLKATIAIRSAAPRLSNGYFCSLVWQLANQKMGMRGGAFGSGGRWSPFTNMFMQSFRAFSVQGNFSSVKASMAQIHHQAAIGLLTQQRRDFAIALPLARYTQTKRHVRKSNCFRRTAQLPATDMLAVSHIPVFADIMPLAERVGQGMLANPAAEEAAVFATRCVTIIVPQVYVGNLSAKGSFADGSAFSADVARLLADDVCQAQRRHTMLVSRLLERISEAGWNVQYRQIIKQVECIEIAIPPSSGITTASSFEALLCRWGFDVSLLGAKIENPRVKASVTEDAINISSVCSKRQPSYSISSAGSSTGTDIMRDLDSRLFSLIVDEVVDPEEAYRDQVRDFLDYLDCLPRLRETHLSSRTSTSHVAYM
ncbi:hypothetical protein COEREDRAFT_85212 [Coemansia reversa NRRL 1564]|uniref:Uncharacterized protein n=1 Tax=Coemansia reversa (strain ATCC 12441 / NRRL 1564) TaxID=763665 RepID=A0A2G5BIC7_COERN|nr:hypothetical protein COEREDRAFT_85212 [Coemansia reversa NRRL 1564]|eukprot:PIA18759.1 hypothetical protein COEREDRAFT_85212 [Coemansia reversa NRRL 1564]